MSKQTAKLTGEWHVFSTGLSTDPIQFSIGERWDLLSETVKLGFDPPEFAVLGQIVNSIRQINPCASVSIRSSRDVIISCPCDNAFGFAKVGFSVMGGNVVLDGSSVDVPTLVDFAKSVFLEGEGYGCKITA
jgi:hypothetical protein